MATLLYTTGIGLRTTSREYNVRPGVRTIETVDDRYISSRVELSNSWEAVILGEVSSPGLALFENIGTETDQDIEICLDNTSTAHVVLKPEEVSQLILSPGAVIQARSAAVGASHLEYSVFSR